jgi:hypothetical protein
MMTFWASYRVVSDAQHQKDWETNGIYINQQRAKRRREINEAILEIMDKRYFCKSSLATAPSRIGRHGEKQSGK